MTDGRGLLGRRRLLKAVGASVGGISLAGCQGFGGGLEDGPRSERERALDTGTATEAGPVTTERGEAPTATSGGPTPAGFKTPKEGENYRKVVHMVRAGADPEGSRPINSLLEEHAGDDTLLYFPKGTYHMDGPWEKREFENFGMVGDGAVLKPPDGYKGFMISVGWSDRAIGFLFKGFTFDISSPNTGVRPLQAVLQDKLLVRDVAVRGIQDVDQDSMRFDVTLASGRGLVENLRLPDGGVAKFPNTGVYVGEVTDGELTFRNCHIAGFPDNGLYASQADGAVRVIGGLYENNNVANIRVSGGALVRGATVRSTRAIDGFNNVRGIRLRSGRDITIEGCDVQYSAVERSDGAITMHNWLESATVRNTRIRVDTDDVPAILAKWPEWDVDDTDGDPTLRMDGITVTGSAANQAAVAIANRDGCQLSNICINQPGSNRHGIRLINSNGGVLRDSSIRVTGEPIVLEESTLDTTGVRTEVADGDDSSMCTKGEKASVA